MHIQAARRQLTAWRSHTDKNMIRIEAEGAGGRFAVGVRASSDRMDEPVAADCVARRSADQLAKSLPTNTELVADGSQRHALDVETRAFCQRATRLARAARARCCAGSAS
jgi:hypothetical protein